MSRKVHKNKKLRASPQQRFGSLVLIKRVSKPKGQYGDVWQTRCDCGATTNVKEQYLFRKPNPKVDCGGTAHTATIASTHKEEYGIWKMMTRRCHFPSHVSYSWYGAVGIIVCDEWRDRGSRGRANGHNLNAFTAWLKHVGPRPSKKHTLDRKNPFKGYFPGNVRWATPDQQARNKRIHYVRAAIAAKARQYRLERHDPATQERLQNIPVPDRPG